LATWENSVNRAPTTINEHVFIDLNFFIFLLSKLARRFQKRPLKSSKKFRWHAFFTDSRTQTRSANANFAQIARQKKVQVFQGQSESLAASTSEAAPKNEKDEKHRGSDKMRDKITLIIGCDTGIGCAAAIAFDNEPAISQSFISESAKMRCPFLSKPILQFTGAMLQRLGRFRAGLPSKTDCSRTSQRASACCPWKNIECVLAHGYTSISAIQKWCFSPAPIPRDGVER
jgi:hypothetical protein